MSALASQRSHVSESAILDYIEGSDRGRVDVENHLDECDECRRLVAELARTSLVSGPWGDEGTPTEPRRERALPQPGSLLSSRYRLGQPLGHGAMGMVYEAVDETLGTPIALKIFWPHLGENPRVLESIRREANLGRRIQHPNVRRVFDVAVSGEYTFLTMELVDGETLDARIRRGGVSEGEALWILGGICEALAAAHAVGIVHRDLKPGNIAIDRRGKVIVMDFGLARDVNAEASRHQGRGLVGTPAYWSPEQARGEPATPASDIYSLGLIAYQLLTGQPFSLGGENVLPPKHHRVVERCLELRPQRRYPNALAVRAALDRSRPPYAFALLGVAAAVAALVIFFSARGGAAPPKVATHDVNANAAPVTVAVTSPPTAAHPAEQPRPEERHEPALAASTTSLSVDALPSVPVRRRRDAREPRAASAPAAAPATPATPATSPAIVAPSGDETTRKPQRPKRPIDRQDPYTGH